MDAGAWDERHRQEERFAGRDPNQFVVNAVKGMTPGTALVLAAGQGQNAVWLAEQGWAVTALDYSGVALEQAAANSVEAGIQIAVEQADLMEWEPTAEYDLVTLVYFHVPFPERHEVWIKAAKAVGPGGHLLLVGHDSRNLEEGFGGPSSPSVLYTASEASRVVGEVLAVKRAETVIRPVETEDGMRHAIDNLVLAQRV